MRVLVAVQDLGKQAQASSDYGMAAEVFKWLAAVQAPESFGPAQPSIDVMARWAIGMDDDTLAEWIKAVLTGQAPDVSDMDPK